MPTSTAAHTRSEPLLVKRVGFSIDAGGFVMDGTPREHFRLSWPLGKLAMYRNFLTIGLGRHYEIAYEDIVSINRDIFLRLRVRHESSHVPQFVSLTGIFLGREIADVVRRNQLPIPVDL